MMIKIPILEKLIDLIMLLIKNRKAGNAFMDNAEIIYAIRRMVHDEKYNHLNIERAVIVKAHNDNGDMMPISYKYITVTYDDFRDPFISIKNKYKAIPVDGEYTIMISELFQKKSISLTADKMPDGMVKNIYKDEGVTFSQLFFLKHNRKEFWYISIGTSVPGECFSTYEHKNELYLLIAKIRAVLKKY